METKSIKTTGKIPEACEFCGGSMVYSDQPYTDEDVHIETFICSECGATCQQFYRIEEEEVWQLQDQKEA